MFLQNNIKPTVVGNKRLSQMVKSISLCDPIIFQKWDLFTMLRATIIPAKGANFVSSIL